MLEPDAKAKLAATVRDLRARLLKDLHDQADGRYRFGVPLDRAGLSEQDRVKRLRLETWLDEQVASDRRNKESPEDARGKRPADGLGPWIPADRPLPTVTSRSPTSR